jgi:hypothetical protein
MNVKIETGLRLHCWYDPRHYGPTFELLRFQTVTNTQFLKLSLKARCETQERDNQALLDYIEEMSTGQLSPMSSKRMSVKMHRNINNIKVSQ